MTLSSPDTHRSPLPADPGAAATGLARWREALAGLPEAAHPPETPAVAALLEGIFGSSPYLTEALLREPAFAFDLLRRGPDAVMPELLASAAERLDMVDATMTRLRGVKRRAALAIAVADLAGLWPLEQVTGALTRLAEASVGAAVTCLLADLHRTNVLALPHPEEPARGSGVIVLGMGKLGAGELNYSSDVDLILFYDEERLRPSRPDRLQQTMVRFARGLVRMLEERTADGYVFRTDLRLRPDPAATPLAVALTAAETYYESMGQNWERAAMIKARPIAGDLAAGERFIERLRPFMWRKSLDFAAVRDIHSIKRQIAAHRGGDAIAVAGHNVKLGRGGIREIEFFTQTQQLIWGGRNPGLRCRATLEALAALVALDQVTPEAAAALEAAYRYLRAVEHRLQMLEDQQTHTVPADPARLAAFARFFGYADADGFARDLRAELETVEAHYAALFEDEPDLGGPGNLVFTGFEDDPDTLATLQAMGFAEPARLSASVRAWHHGRYRATRSTRARELLTELMPSLLAALSRTLDPDAASRRFDLFLQALPAGVPLFSLFQAAPELMDLVAEVLGSAPHLADHLTRHPGVLDAVLSGESCEGGLAQLAPELDAALTQARDFQDVLDVTRRWAHDKSFLIGVGMLRGTLDPLPASAALSDVAEVVIAALLQRVEHDFAAAHGGFGPGAGGVVLAFGKLGGRELTLTSDIDIVVVYDVPGGETALSDGPKPLAPSTYFMRLTQRLVTAITTQTGEGKLYEVDLRLRPSGQKGPLAVSLAGFEAYQRNDAWTWEHMALTRARAIAGSPEIVARVGAVIAGVLGAPRDPTRLLVDVASMRERMAVAHPTESVWAVKHVRGGLVDLEFIAQYLMLRHAGDHPAIVTGNTAAAFGRLREAGLLDPADADTLEQAAHLWCRIQNMLRLAGDGPFREAVSSPALCAALARAAGEPDLPALKVRLDATAATVQALYAKLVDEPAAAAEVTEHAKEKTA